MRKTITKKFTSRQRKCWRKMCPRLQKFFPKSRTCWWNQKSRIVLSNGSKTFVKEPASTSKTSVLSHLKLAFCCWLAGLMARRERGAYPLRYVTSEQRSQRACEPQPLRGAAAL